jgi:MYXO-CTERM domain-containing protein
VQDNCAPGQLCTSVDGSLVCVTQDGGADGGDDGGGDATINDTGVDSDGNGQNPGSPETGVSGQQGDSGNSPPGQEVSGIIEGGGCSCTAAGEEPSSLAGALMGAFGLGAWMARRRKRRT